MKTTIAAVVLMLFGASAFAQASDQVTPRASNMDYPTVSPTSSDWAKWVVSQACGLEIHQADTGSMIPFGDIFIFTVIDKDGKLRGQATASDSGMGSDKLCKNIGL